MKTDNRVSSIEDIHKLIARKAEGYKFMSKYFVSYFGFTNWLRRFKGLKMSQAKSMLDKYVDQYETHVLSVKYFSGFVGKYGISKYKFDYWLKTRHNLKPKDCNLDDYVAIYREEKGC